MKTQESEVTGKILVQNIEIKIPERTTMSRLQRYFTANLFLEIKNNNNN